MGATAPLITPGDIRASLARLRFPLYQLAARVEVHPARLSPMIYERRPLPRLAGQVLDVAGAAQLIGVSEKSIRSRVARGLLPHRRWGGRVVFLEAELLTFLQQLPGLTPEQALQNVAMRAGASA